MNRFSKHGRWHFPGSSILLPASMTAGILLAGFLAAAGIRRDTGRRERENLERALNQSVTLCYALEGRYPESLQYLKDHYGIRWDENRYLVDFETVGSNLPPDVTVIDLSGGA